MKITPEEIENAYTQHCDSQDICHECKYYNRDVECAFTFALDYIEKKSLEKVEGKDIDVPTKLPEWCKVGAWVVAKIDLGMNKRVKDCVIKRIVEVSSFGGITVATLKGGGVPGIGCEWHEGWK